MSDRDIIHNYLKSLSKYLSRLEKADAEDVIREIESHIYDVLEAHEADGSKTDAEAILAGFGQPRDLAAGYVEHILEGAAPPSGFKAIQQVKKGATKGLYFGMGLFGYSIALALILIGIYKPFEPEIVGVWVGDPGNSFIVGVVADMPEGTHELLGWWLIPVAIGLGIGIAYLTKRVLSVLKHKL